ncbi:carbamoyltransferase [Alphaproteobacteria bacterium]|nr:carbamoyltransferase [Alphaproteobacteria bacterium]
MTYLLGISAFYHDSAAALISDGEIIAAAQEERFTRIKHDSSFPINSIRYLLDECKINLTEIDYLVFYDKPFLKFERLLETYLAFVPKGFISFSKSMPIWLREKLFLKNNILKQIKKINKNFDKKKLLFAEHHLSHAASAFYPSPYNEAIIVTIDSVGEWSTTSVCIGKGSHINIEKEIHFPHSLGLLYSAFTYYIGFKVNSGEYKVMGLAPYGKPIYKELIFEKIINVKDDGSFWLDQSYFNYTTGLKMISDKFIKLFGQPVRKPNEEEINQFHMDIAASIQNVIEEVILKITKNLSEKYDIKNLCLAGGVALNCVANGKVLRQKFFKNIWIQPASGDAGGALGCALLVWYYKLKNTREIRSNDSMKGSYLGPSFEQSFIEEELKKTGAKYKLLNDEEITSITAKKIYDGKAIGWFQGRMEFGPRALGNRSIIADPRSEQTQKNLNLKIKFRESFRPFAPSIIREKIEEWFDLNIDSPYMLMVSDVKKNKLIKITEEENKKFGLDKLNIKRSIIPAVTHIDNSARIQTVHKETNIKYYSLIKKFEDLSNCPLVVNTSFNIRGEPIVCTPLDAYKCYMGTNLDVLVIGNCYLEKEESDYDKIDDYQKKYELD